MGWAIFMIVETSVGAEICISVYFRKPALGTDDSIELKKKTQI